MKAEIPLLRRFVRVLVIISCVLHIFDLPSPKSPNLQPIGDLEILPSIEHSQDLIQSHSQA